MGKNAIVVDTRQIDRLAYELKGFEKEVAKAAGHALNRTISSVMTATARAVAKEYNIRQSEIKLPANATKKEYKNAILKAEIRQPTSKSLLTYISFSGRTLTLMHFSISPKEKFPVPTGATRVRPVKVKIKRSGGFKRINTDPKPFVFKFATNKNLNVWHRTTKRFYPIEPIRTLSVPQMIMNEKVERQIMQAAEETLGKRLEHEVGRAMDSVKNRVERK